MTSLWYFITYRGANLLETLMKKELKQSQLVYRQKNNLIIRPASQMRGYAAALCHLSLN